MRVTAGISESEVEAMAIEVVTVLADFDEYWQPFTLGAGPIPSYRVRLDPAARRRIKLRRRPSLPVAGNDSVTLTARAWALKGAVR